MKNKIINLNMIVQVGDLKLFDIIGGEMIVGFSEDGEEVYMQECGEEGGVYNYKEILDMREGD